MQLQRYTLTDIAGETLTEHVDAAGKTTSTDCPGSFGDNGPTASVVFTFDNGEVSGDGDFWRFVESALGIELFTQHCERLTVEDFQGIFKDFKNIDVEDHDEALDTWLDNVDVT